MPKKTKSFAQWCKENGEMNVLSELDYDRNSEWCSAERIEYNSPIKLGWKCGKGHEYQCEVVGRTLFGLKCPICHPKESVLPVGTKYGCLTIVGDFNVYQKEIAATEIEKYEKQRKNFLNGIREPNSNLDSTDFYDHLIEMYRNRKWYKYQCKCGKTGYLDQQHFLRARHKYCTSAVSEKDLEGCRWSEDILNKYCGLAIKAWEKKNRAIEKEYARDYFTNFEGTTFNSLKILECIDDNHMELHRQGDLRTNNSCRFVIYKIYKYRCYLCGDEGVVKCSQLHIDRDPSRYGYKFRCHCHEPSLFEWVVSKVLIDNNVPYRVEYAFDDLPGKCGLKLLRFDFAILAEDNSIKCLIECQGSQHNKPVEIFGGERTFKNQSINDALKKEYAQNHSIPLIEIPYKHHSYDKVVAILKKHSII